MISLIVQSRHIVPTGSLAVASLLVFTTPGLGRTLNGAEIPAGKFAPLFGVPEGWTNLTVSRFFLDRTAVSQDAYGAFQTRHPEWTTAAQPGTDGRLPATEVTWFAARAYCKDLGGRLPTTLEWEYAAAADETSPDGSGNQAFVDHILAWYGRPKSADTPVRVDEGAANFYGVKAMHGRIWEWTEDFDSAFAMSDSRSQGDRAKALFCGASNLGAAKKTDYAAFMRYAMRGSLKAKDTQPNLGFRCAYDQKEGVAPDVASWKSDGGSATSLKGAIGDGAMVAMIYASCQAACPLILRTMGQVDRMAKAKHLDLNVVFVSLDAEHDTPQKLAAFKNHMHASPQWRFIVGTPTDTREFAALLGVRFHRDAKTGEIAHDNKIVYVGPDGQPGPELEGLGGDVAALIDATQKLKGAPALTDSTD